jgi:hypothetical protein
LKNDICNKDYSSFVDIVQYKDRNPNKYDRNKELCKELRNDIDYKKLLRNGENQDE